jgi:hypothetical protein
VDERERRQWIEDEKRRLLAPWGEKRGVGVIERNGHAVHVRAGVEETAAELARSAVRWEKDALGKPVRPGAANLIVFRLRGSAWTIVVDDMYDARELSLALKTEVIDFMVSDTWGGAIGYTWFDKGERVEHFRGSEDGSEDEFESTLRSLSRRERKKHFDVVEKFFVERDAYEPGLAYEYFFRQGEPPARTSRLLGIDPEPPAIGPRLGNPGIVCVLGDERIVSKPDLERIDFIVTRENPGKSGGIWLG